jgi:hypothetical protein
MRSENLPLSSFWMFALVDIIFRSTSKEENYLHTNLDDFVLNSPINIRLLSAAGWLGKS